MTDFKEIEEKLRKFNEEREWTHLNPKEILIAMMSEVGELADCYRWLNEEQLKKLHLDPEKKKKVEEEIADIFIYLIHIARETNTDILQAIESKIEKNRIKYPLAYKGMHTNKLLKGNL